MKAQTKYCQKCLMPATTPGIILLDDGASCNYCESYQPQEMKGVEALVEVIRSGANPDQPYDCIVPMSGGLDSFYVAYYLTRNLNLKCLGLHYDTGLGSQSSVETLNWIEQELEIPIVYRRLEPELTHEIIRENVRSLIDLGAQYLQIAFCGHCGFGRRAATYREMVERRLPAVRGSHTTDKFPFRYCLGVDNDELYSAQRWPHTMKALDGKYKQAEALQPPGYNVSEIPVKPFGYPDISETHGDIPDVAFFDYVAWDKKKILADLNEAGIDTSILTRPHSDCRLSPSVDQLIRDAWTIGKKEVYVSNQIRAGILTKEEGEAMYTKLQSQELDTSMLTEIGFTDDEIEQIYGRKI